MSQAESLGDVVGMLQQQAAAGKPEEADMSETPGGLFVAPGVRFSNRLWTKLGGKAKESDRQSRRERMTGSTALPAPRFDAEFRRDSVWKQRYVAVFTHITPCQNNYCKCQCEVPKRKVKKGFLHSSSSALHSPSQNGGGISTSTHAGRTAIIAHGVWVCGAHKRGYFRAMKTIKRKMGG